MFIFGLRADEVNEMRLSGYYSPWDVYNENREIRDAIDMIASGFFSPENPNLFEPIVDNLLKNGDYYFILKDLVDYDRARMEANELYRNKTEWYKKTLINIAKMGKFSSDRTIKEYADDIWNIKQITSDDSK
jgi:starch phosphorylase